MDACRAMHAASLEGSGDVNYFSTNNIRRDDFPAVPWATHCSSLLVRLRRAVDVRYKMNKAVTNLVLHSVLSNTSPKLQKKQLKSPKKLSGHTRPEIYSGGWDRDTQSRPPPPESTTPFNVSLFTLHDQNWPNLNRTRTKPNKVQV